MRRSYPPGVALAAGTVMMLLNGVVYAWSIYTAPFAEGFGWTSAQLGMGFTVMLAAFCLGGVAGGALAGRLGVRFTVPAGGVLGCLGYLLCLFLRGERLWLLYLAFSVAGLGVGFVYNGILSAVVPRFPGKGGMASGVLLMGYGASTLLVGSLAARLIEAPAVGWHLTYLLTGLMLLVTAFAGGLFLRPPAADRAAEDAPAEGLRPAQAVRTRRFRLYFLIAMLGTGFGSGIIAHGRALALEAGAAASLATLAVGLVSVTNGLGRVAFGLLHDRFGFRVSLPADAALFIASGALAAVCLRAGLTLPLVAALMLLGAAYGAVPTLTSPIARDFFGPAHYGRNLSLMNLNILPGAFASAAAGAIQTATGSYAGALWLFAGLECLALALCVVLAKTPPEGARRRG